MRRWVGEVIAIGDELTSGQRLDTNSQWISQRLGELGIAVLFHTTVGDELAACEQVFRQAAERADIVVSTGGLGPTADDLTRHALAAALGVELVEDAASLEHIRALFARRKRPMPQANVIQAQFPRGARVIANPHGTAPGIDVQLAGTARTARCFALPGVPAEMREMWDESVTPALRELLGAAVRVIRHRCIKCFGVGESDLEQMLPDLIRRGRRPAVGITVSRATITLRITAEADSVASCEALIAPTEATIRRQLGELVFGEEDDELEHAVVRLLAARGQSVAVAEWGTGGLVAQWLAQAARGQPERLRGWYGIGNLAAFDKLVAGVPAGDVNPASPEAVAERMARACCALFDADYALAVGPFPDRDGPGQEPGRVGLALAAGSAVQTHAPWFAGHPDILAARVAKQALDLLRRELMRSG